MDEEFARDVLFSLWSPLAAVTVASGRRKNAFIASSVTCASFAPPNPMRLTVQMMKVNYSYELVQESRAFAVHLLSKDDMDLVRWLATASGRGRAKLESLSHSTGVTGSPLLDSAVAYIECRVVNQMDAGDRKVFLGEVVAAQKLKDADLLTYPHFLASASPEMMEEHNKYMAPLRPVIAELAKQVHPNVERDGE